MNRRQLLSTTAAAAASQALSFRLGTLKGAAPKAQMKLGCQSGPTTEQRLQFFARHSVQGICGYAEDSQKQGSFSVDDLSRIKERCDKYKVNLECIEPGFLASRHIERKARPVI